MRETNKEKNILLFIKTPPPNTGATLMNTFVRDSELIKKSFQVFLIPVSYAKNVKSLGNYGISKFFKVFSYSLKLIKHLTSEKPDLVYFQISPLGIAFFRDMLFVSIIKLFNTKILFHLHGKGIKAYVENSNFKKKLYKYAFNNSEIIFLSNRLTYDLEGLYSGPKHIIPNGIPVFNKSITLDKKTNTEAINLLFLSNLIISKGVLGFIDALSILKKNKINFSTTIIGAEADLKKEELNQLLSDKKLINHCQYVGPKYGEEKYSELHKADVLVFPTINEAFGLVIIEAMQMSTVVISTNEGAIPEIIDDGKTGFIVEKNNPKDIADKIEVLYNDKMLLEQMKKKAKAKFFQHYTLEHFEQSIVRVLKKVVKCAE